MGNSNGKITAPVSLHADVYPVLGLNKTGTYYDIGHANGNTHGQTNPWAKYKPERVNTPAEITLDQRKDNNCGLTPYLVSTLSGLADAYEQHPEDMHGWTYSPPRPGTDWCRLTDWDGYNHNARPQYDKFNSPGTVALNQQTFYFVCTMAEESTRADMVNFSDLEDMGELYFGVYITGTRTKCATSDSPGGSSVAFKTNTFVVGDYTAYPFLSSVKQTQDAVMQAGRFYTVPGCEPVEFSIVQTTISPIIRAYKGTSGVIAIRYEVEVSNSGGSTRLTNNTLYLRYADKDINDTMVSGERRIELPDVTAANGITSVATGTFTSIPSDLYANAKLWVRLGGGLYVASAVPMMSAEI